MLICTAFGLSYALAPGEASAQGVLRIAMTAADIPLATGQTDQGGEGQRFMGYTAYDSLVLWDLSAADRPSVLMPGLATSWAVDANDRTRWTFKIREGVRFHDGSEFTADAAAWNFDKLLRNDAPHFDPRQAAQGRSRIPAVASWRAIDRYTLEITPAPPTRRCPTSLHGS
jgi:ABC-type transport system substrate-binding protein